jgi:hypothetical protein
LRVGVAILARSLLDPAAIDKRVDAALVANSRAETIVIGMAIGIFLVGGEFCLPAIGSEIRMFRQAERFRNCYFGVRLMPC